MARLMARSTTEPKTNSADPTESRDLSAQLPGAVDALNATLQRYADGMSDAVACDQPADNKYLAIWAKRGFVSPWLDDPLYMYSCSAAICPPGAPSAPTRTACAARLRRREC